MDERCFQGAAKKSKADQLPANDGFIYVNSVESPAVTNVVTPWRLKFSRSFSPPNFHIPMNFSLINLALNFQTN